MTPPPASHAPVKGWVNASQWQHFAVDGTLAKIATRKTPETLYTQPVLVLPLDASGGVSEALVERCVKADLTASYCRGCFGYERNSESCEDCARKRVRAVLSALVSAATTETGT